MLTLSSDFMKARVKELFFSHGLTSAVEYQLPNGRRLDVAAFSATGSIAGVEIKTNVKDFNRDLKWPTYLAFCKVFYFAVPLGFPYDILPKRLGVIIVNNSSARILRGLSKTNRFPTSVLLRA